MAATRTLILMRHAAAAGGARDEDRPLTAGGELAATEAGDWIRAALPAVDAVLCSIAARTRQTLAALAIDAPTEYLDELYNGGVDDIGSRSGWFRIRCIPCSSSGTRPDSGDRPPSWRPRTGLPPSPLIDELRYFSAGALAVLRADTRWDELVRQWRRTRHRASSGSVTCVDRQSGESPERVSPAGLVLWWEQPPRPTPPRAVPISAVVAHRSGTPTARLPGRIADGSSGRTAHRSFPPVVGRPRPARRTRAHRPTASRCPGPGCNRRAAAWATRRESTSTAGSSTASSRPVSPHSSACSTPTCPSR